MRLVERLHANFVRDAVRTHVVVDGQAVGDFDEVGGQVRPAAAHAPLTSVAWQAFWEVLRRMGWTAGIRALYMCTGDALANSYEQGRTAVARGRENLLFVQAREEQRTEICTKQMTVTLRKAFDLALIEPFERLERWHLVKTYEAVANSSADEWRCESLAPGSESPALSGRAEMVHSPGTDSSGSTGSTPDRPGRRIRMTVLEDEIEDLDPLCIPDYAALRGKLVRRRRKPSRLYEALAALLYV